MRKSLPSSLPKIGVVIDLVEKIFPLAAAQATPHWKPMRTQGNKCCCCWRRHGSEGAAAAAASLRTTAAAAAASSALSRRCSSPLLFSSPSFSSSSSKARIASSSFSALFLLRPLSLLLCGCLQPSPRPPPPPGHRESASPEDLYLKMGLFDVWKSSCN